MFPFSDNGAQGGKVFRKASRQLTEFGWVNGP